MLILERPWTRQPQGPFQLAPGLAPAFLALPAFGAIASKPMTYPAKLYSPAIYYDGLSNTTVRKVGSQSGLGAEHNSGDTYAPTFKRENSSFEAYIEVPNGSDYTWIFQADIAGYQGTNPGFYRSVGGTGNNFLLWPTSGLWIRHNAADFTSTSGRITGPVTVVARVRSAANVSAWLNGRRVINASTAVATDGLAGSAAPRWFGKNGDLSAVTERLYGVFNLIGLLWEAPADGWCQSISINPWQLFAPRRILIPTAAAAGYTHPTLSLATATEITATGFKPRVTYTFA